MPLEREDLIEGLRELVAGLAARGEHVGIRIVGGAALALYYFDRQSISMRRYIPLRPFTKSQPRLQPATIGPPTG